MRYPGILSQPGRYSLAWLVIGLTSLLACLPDDQMPPENLSSPVLDASAQPASELDGGQRQQPHDAASLAEAGPEAGPDASELTDAEPPHEEAMEDDAEIIEVDLPQRLACGASAQGRILVENTGSSTWSRQEGYKLGAVGSEDPFHERPRVWLGQQDELLPGEQHPFVFPLQAPDEPGQYRSDWRMVHEGVRWFGESVTQDIQVDCDVDEPPPPEPPVPNLNEVVWLHSDVSDWPETATLRSVRLRRAQICLDYNRANEWPEYNREGTWLVGNPWIFIWQDNRWYAGTWEWLRPGQTCKNIHAVAGSHIKREPFPEHGGWLPRSGHTYYFMVSGLARFRERNIEARTNLVRFVWP